MIVDRCHYGTGANRSQRRQRGNRNGLVEGIDPVDDFGINGNQATLRGVQVAASGISLACDDARPHQERSNCRSRGVLGQVTGVQARAVNRFMTGSDQCLTVGAGETAAFLHGAVGQAQAVRQQQAFAFRDGKFAEDHAALPL